MLKKAPNTILSIRFQIIDSDSFLDLQIPQHTIMKEIENMIAKKLKINPFKIQFTFQHTSTNGILNPTSTLYQNQVQNKDTVYVKIINIQTRSQAKSISVKGQSDQKNMTLLDIISGKPQKLECVTKGLNLNVVCSNKRCFNYNKNTIVQLGLGKFNYNHLIGQLKCPVCPDKIYCYLIYLIIISLNNSQLILLIQELNVNPVCMIKDFLFKQCLWSLEGMQIHKGIQAPHKLQQWVVVGTQDYQNFNKILYENQWTNVNIIVREIGYPKQKIPLLL